MNCRPSFSQASAIGMDPALGESGRRLGTFSLTGKVRGQSEPRRRRVPDCDIIDVGRRAGRVRESEAIDVRELAFAAPPSAVTSDASPKPAGRRSLAPWLLACLIVEIAIAGAMYLGQRYAESSVIVVPATVNERSVIT